MMKTGMNLRAGFGTTKTRRNLPPHRELHPKILTMTTMTTMTMTKLWKPLRHLRHHARRARTLPRDVAGDDVVGAGVGVGVVTKSNRRYHLPTRQMPRATQWILTMTSARLCLKKIRKISSACQQAASRLSVAFRMSPLRRRHESLTRKMTPTMTTKWVKA